MRRTRYRPRTPPFPSGSRHVPASAGLLLRPSPGVVGRLEGLRPDRKEHKCRRAVGVGGCEQRAQRAAVVHSEQDGSLAAGCVQDRANVVHADLVRPGAWSGRRVGEPEPAPVEQDQPRHGRELVEKLSELGHVPRALEIREPPWRIEEVEGTASHHLVGDVQPIDCLRVADGRTLHGAILDRS